MSSERDPVKAKGSSEDDEGPAAKGWDVAHTLETLAKFITDVKTLIGFVALILSIAIYVILQVVNLKSDHMRLEEDYKLLEGTIEDLESEQKSIREEIERLDFPGLSSKRKNLENHVIATLCEFREGKVEIDHGTDIWTCRDDEGKLVPIWFK